jgi:glycosyltransferase involved in cell wall biosynthesis
MAESAVFASFSYLKGLGLPPLEAMASNCLVCGFDGHGGSDFATADNGQWVQEGDHEGFADAVAMMQADRPRARFAGTLCPRVAGRDRSN